MNALNEHASSPEALHRLMAKFFNEGNLDALLSLYETDATLVPSPGSTTTGTEGLREALRGFLELQPRDTFVNTLRVLESGSTALAASEWGLTGTAPHDGSSIQLRHRGIEVMRRQADGTWRFVIDDPFGGD